MQLLAGAASSEHWMVEPLSLELKPRRALVDVVELGGPELIEVLGGVASTVDSTDQLRVAGEGSVLPAASTARTDTL